MNKKFLPLLNLVPTTVAFIAFRIALTPIVNILWFGCQKAFYVNKRHNNAIFWCSKFRKINFDCLCSFLYQKLKPLQLCVSFLDSVIYYYFRDSNIFKPLFGLQSQSMVLAEEKKKVIRYNSKRRL